MVSQILNPDKGVSVKNHEILRLSLLILIAAAITATAITLLSASRSTQHAPRSTQHAPRLTLTADSITDAATGQPVNADVYVNDALLYEQVTHFQVTVPLDGSAEIRVAAPGYKPWGIRPRGGGSDKTLSGPIRLTPLTTDH
jgi:hypothetical protein